MKFNIFGLTLLVLLVTTANVPALAQIGTDTSDNTTEQEKVNKIKELIVLTGEENALEQTLYQMLPLMKSQMPQVPQQFWDTFMAELNINEIGSKLIPIYSKYLTTEDIEGLIKFYKTPLGRKMIAVSPEIRRESMKVGQQYGAEAGKRALQKLEEQGYIRR